MRTRTALITCAGEPAEVAHNPPDLTPLSADPSVALAAQLLEDRLRPPEVAAIEPAGQPHPKTTGGPNAVHPTLMTPDERVREISEILAGGLTRLKARQSSRLSADRGESSLDCAGDQSGHANVLNGGMA